MYYGSSTMLFVPSLIFSLVCTSQSKPLIGLVHKYSVIDLAQFKNLIGLRIRIRPPLEVFSLSQSIVTNRL